MLTGVILNSLPWFLSELLALSSNATTFPYLMFLPLFIFYLILSLQISIIPLTYSHFQLMTFSFIDDMASVRQILFHFSTVAPTPLHVCTHILYLSPFTMDGLFYYCLRPITPLCPGTHLTFLTQSYCSYNYSFSFFSISFLLWGGWETATVGNL